jgi:hypothetical protein
MEKTRRPPTAKPKRTFGEPECPQYGRIRVAISLAPRVSFTKERALRRKLKSRDEPSRQVRERGL